MNLVLFHFISCWHWQLGTKCLAEEEGGKEKKSNYLINECSTNGESCTCQEESYSHQSITQHIHNFFRESIFQKENMESHSELQQTNEDEQQTNEKLKVYFLVMLEPWFYFRPFVIFAVILVTRRTGWTWFCGGETKCWWKYYEFFITRSEQPEQRKESWFE